MVVGLITQATILMLNSGLLKELHAKVADEAYVLYESVEVFRA